MRTKVALIFLLGSLICGSVSSAAPDNCDGTSFEAGVDYNQKENFPATISGCLTDDTSQINVMIAQDDGVTSYYSGTAAVPDETSACQEGECNTAGFNFQKTGSNSFEITMSDGKPIGGTKQPLKIDVDLLALKEDFAGGRAGPTGPSQLAGMCASSDYNCIDESNPSNSFVSNIEFEMGVTPGTLGQQVQLSKNRFVRYPTGSCLHQIGFVEDNSKKLKIWDYPYSSREVILSGPETITNGRGAEIHVSSVGENALFLTASCSGDDSSSGSAGPNTWRDYCLSNFNSGASTLNVSERVECMENKCYGSQGFQTSTSQSTQTNTNSNSLMNNLATGLQNVIPSITSNSNVNFVSTQHDSDLSCGTLVRSFCESTGISSYVDPQNPGSEEPNTCTGVWDE